nr:integrase core domain-containing protein [Candidatus Palauibacter scopulicola]
MSPERHGHEFCGLEDEHPYELFLQLEEIEHRNTKVGRPRSNGLIERFHRTLLDEHLRGKGPDDMVRVRRGDAR